MKINKLKYKLVRQILKNLENLINGWAFNMKLHKKIAPSIYSNWFQLATFSTKVKDRPELGKLNTNRIYNIEKCAQIINGLVLDKKDIFSLMKIIGEPSLKKGFKAGPVIINGKLENSSGGGICQVSTTLFNAALLANLTILQKYNHSRDVWGKDRLIDLGRDAAFVYLLKDLKFRNNFNHKVVILLNFAPETMELKCTLLSEFISNFQVKIESTILKELTYENPSNPENNYSGWVVETKRITSYQAKELITYKKIETYLPGNTP